MTFCVTKSKTEITNFQASIFLSSTTMRRKSMLSNNPGLDGAACPHLLGLYIVRFLCSRCDHDESRCRFGADSLSLNREVVRGVLCPDISSPAASLLVADSLYLDRKVIRGILCRLLHVASDIPRNGNSLRNRSSTVLCSMCSAAYLGHPWVR